MYILLKKKSLNHKKEVLTTKMLQLLKLLNIYCIVATNCLSNLLLQIYKFGLLHQWDIRLNKNKHKKQLIARQEIDNFRVHDYFELLIKVLKCVRLDSPTTTLQQLYII